MRPAPVALDFSFAIPRFFLLQFDLRHVLAPAGRLKSLLLDCRTNFSDEHLCRGPGPIGVPRMRLPDLRQEIQQRIE
jgi:hypothetical protein